MTAAYLAAHGAEMRAEIAGAAETCPEVRS